MNVKINYIVSCCLVISVACTGMDNSTGKVLVKRKRGSDSQSLSSKAIKPLITAEHIFDNPIQTGQQIARALGNQEDTLYKQVRDIIAYENIHYNHAQKAVILSRILNVLRSYPNQFNQQKDELLDIMRGCLSRLPDGTVDELQHYLYQSNGN